MVSAEKQVKGAVHDPLADTIWDPIVMASELASKVSARTRHVCIFLGAGTSCAAGLPNVAELQELVLKKLSKPDRSLAEGLFSTGNFEAGLSRLRRIRTLLRPGQDFEGFNEATALDLDKKLTGAIIAVFETIPDDLRAVIAFCNWAAGDYYKKPIELFTVNYDLLLERGLESVGAPYFDGFVGNLDARFRGDLVEATGSPEDAFPSSFVRLWKLHGSLNWQMTDQGEVVRKGQPLTGNDIAAIYPSDEKYDQSRRVPFVTLQDRLRKALAMPETLTVLTGYSFSDQHLNEIIYDAARKYPRSEVIVLCHNKIPQELKELLLSNMSVYGPREAIIGGELRPWKKPKGTVENIWDNNAFQLGNFEALAQFISRSRHVDQGPLYLSPLRTSPSSDGNNGNNIE